MRRPENITTETIVSEAGIRERNAELAALINSNYEGEQLVLVGILNGAAMFATDLARAIHVSPNPKKCASVMLDFVGTSSYGNQTKSSGTVTLTKDLSYDIRGKHVLIVDDIVDSGQTLLFLKNELSKRCPASLKTAVFLLKGNPNQKPLRADYVGHRFQDGFVVGYGLDYAGLYRELPYVGVLNPALIKE